MGSEIITGNFPLMAIIGPTATGKSDLALALAEISGAEIVSADSMQIYRFMDIGTAKPSGEIRMTIPHHFIDILTPDKTYSAGLFSRQAHALITRKRENNVPLIIVGGTGLYIKALEKGLVELPPIPEEIQVKLWEEFINIGGRALYERLQNIDPAIAGDIHPNDRFRILRALGVFETTGVPLSAFREKHGFKNTSFRLFKIGLTYPREILYKRIEERVERMILNGWLDEVKELLKMGYDETLKPMQAIGYKQLIKVLKGRLDLESATNEIKKETRHLAKRQITWFKKEAPHLWINPEESGPHKVADKLLTRIRQGEITWTRKKV
jgi:tRNA dimethylallyltransferase